MMTNPIVWVAVAGWLMAGGTFAFQKIKQGQQWQVAYDQGFSAGKGSASTSAVTSATATAAAERKALDDTPLTVERAAIIEACKREASCRNRGKL